MVRNRVIFKGRVQGVGFRHAAKMQARSYRVYGQARNLKDGTVELVIEGDREEVAQFIASLQESMGGLIKETNITIEVASGGYEEFNILY